MNWKQVDEILDCVTIVLCAFWVLTYLFAAFMGMRVSASSALIGFVIGHACSHALRRILN